MSLGRYKQKPYDKRKRVINYTDFLETEETVTDVDEVIVEPTTDPPFVVDNVAIDEAGKKIVYYAGGGIDGETYAVSFRTITSLDQQRDDTIEFDVEVE